MEYEETKIEHSINENRTIPANTCIISVSYGGRSIQKDIFEKIMVKFY